MAYKTSLYILLSSIGISNGEKSCKTKKVKEKAITAKTRQTKKGTIVTENSSLLS